MAIYLVYQDAENFMKSWTPSVSLQRHMLAVALAMRAYAHKFGEDAEKWAITGVLHDFDYEKMPETHPQHGVEILREMGYGSDILEAILGHADRPEWPRHSLMARTLFAVDELVGLITAAVYVRPDKSLLSLELDSLKRKFKDKAFAKNISRDDLLRGAAELEQEPDEHFAFVLAALKPHAANLGLDGQG